jgi:hypothetical protein
MSVIWVWTSHHNHYVPHLTYLSVCHRCPACPSVAAYTGQLPYYGLSARCHVGCRLENNHVYSHGIYSIKIKHMRLHILMVASMKVAVFWNAPCSLMETDQCLKGACCLHPQGIAQFLSGYVPEDSHLHSNIVVLSMHILKTSKFSMFKCESKFHNSCSYAENVT